MTSITKSVLMNRNGNRVDIYSLQKKKMIEVYQKTGSLEVINYLENLNFKRIKVLWKLR
jgi:hypothetical protein